MRTPLPLRQQVAQQAALVAGLFCVALALAMLLDHWRGGGVEPLHPSELADLKLQLAQNPSDETLKQRIRDLDLHLRVAHEGHGRRRDRGAWLLLAGGAVFLAAIQVAFWRRRVQCALRKTKPPGTDERLLRRAATAVLVVALTVLGASWALARFSGTHLTTDLVQPPASPLAADAPAPSTPFPSPEEVARNWPRFRGPGGAGTSAFTNVPVAWDVQTGKGVVWKTPAPTADFSSPVLWGNRLFLTGASKTKRDVYCYDALKGTLVWQRPVQNVPGSSAAPLELPEASGGYAPCTPATDGRRVYAMFADGDVVAFDYAGGLAWSRGFGNPDNSYGHATSLELWRDRLLVLLDQGDGEGDKSKLHALDTATGKTVWESPPRPVPHSWATPVAFHDGKREQIVTAANPWVIAYDPAQGAELWRAKVLNGEVTPSPIYGAGFAFTVNEGAQLSALRTDGTGDVTKTHVAWIADAGLPDICSPLCDGQRVYLLQTYGNLTCYAAPTGQKLWEKDLELEFKASPALMGERLLLLSAQGTAIFVAAAATFKELGRAELKDEVWASPVFGDGRLYLRGKTNLYCLGAESK